MLSRFLQVIYHLFCQMNSTKALKARTKLTSDIFSFCTAAFCLMYISFNRTLTQWQNSLWNVTGYEFTIMSTTEEQCWLLLILLLHYCNAQWKWNQGKQVVKVICHKAASPSASIFQRYCSTWHDSLGQIQVCLRNRITISSAVFAGHTCVTNKKPLWHLQQ